MIQQTLNHSIVIEG